MVSRGRISVDVAVLGAGTAGLAAYRAAVAAGARTVIIEGGDYGTTCARVGCMPSKLMLAAAEAAHIAMHGQPFGVHATAVVNGREVMDRVRRERDRFVGGVVAGVEKIPATDKVRGYGSFVAPGLLAIADVRVDARAIVIATGSSPYVPKMFQDVKDRLVVNDDVFDWSELPRSVAVFGAGAIGIELGQALSRLGVRVRVFGHHGRLAGLEDPEVKSAALAAFREELPIDLDAKVDSVSLGGDGVIIHTRDERGDEKDESFEFALVAAGRRPNLRRLALHAAGIPLTASGIPAYDETTLQCGDTPVFIAGDANAEIPLLHEAADEGAIAGENAVRFPNVIAGPRRSRLAIVFSDPELASVGTRFADLPDPASVVTGKVSFVDQGRSRIMLQNRGRLHVYVHAESGVLLGAEIAGPRAEHLGHLLAWAHQQHMTVDQMLAMPFYHPVVEEGLRTALRDARASLAARRPTSASPRLQHSSPTPP